MQLGVIKCYAQLFIIPFMGKNKCLTLKICHEVAMFAATFNILSNLQNFSSINMQVRVEMLSI